VVIGRAPDCDLVIAASTASRKHALVRLASDGPELVPFGRGPTLLDGQPVRGSAALKHGSQLQVGTVSIRVGVAEAVPQPTRWLLAAPTQERIPLPQGRSSAGGSLADDVVIPCVPAGWMALDAGPDGVRVQIDGEPDRMLLAGDALHVAGRVFRLERAARGTQETTRLDSGGLPSRVRLAFLPRGGRLHVIDGPHPVELYLTERRCALVAVLLQPPAGLSAGDPVPDTLLRPRIWRDGGDRHGLNVLIARVRRDLHNAGLNGHLLIERLKGGGATRFALAPGGQAVVV